MIQGTTTPTDICHHLEHHFNITKKKKISIIKKISASFNSLQYRDMSWLFRAQFSSKLEFEQVGLHNQHISPRTAPNNQLTKERNFAVLIIIIYGLWNSVHNFHSAYLAWCNIDIFTKPRIPSDHLSDHYTYYTGMLPSLQHTSLVSWQYFH